jgi:hypothetical protein
VSYASSVPDHPVTILATCPSGGQSVPAKTTCAPRGQSDG